MRINTTTARTTFNMPTTLDLDMYVDLPCQRQSRLEQRLLPRVQLLQVPQSLLQPGSWSRVMGTMMLNIVTMTIQVTSSSHPPILPDSNSLIRTQGSLLDLETVRPLNSASTQKNQVT